MGLTEQNPAQSAIMILKGSNLAPESVSMLRAAKTIVLQGCDVGNTLERTSIMAAKGEFLRSQLLTLRLVAPI